MTDSEKRLEQAREQYVSNWRARNSELANPIQAERLKNSFKAGALWGKEESKIDAYIMAFESYKASNTLGLDDETLLCEFNEWYIKYTE